MTVLVAAVVSVSFPLVGALFIRRAEGPERRWATVGTLLVALATVGVVSWSHLQDGGAWVWGHGMLALRVDSLSSTMAPAMLLAGLALALGAGRAVIAAPSLPVLPAVLGLSLGVVFSGHPATALLFEAMAAGLLASAMSHDGRRSTAIYLGASACLMGLGAAGIAVSLGSGGGVAPVWVVAVVLVATALRLGLVPLGTGLAAAYRGGMTTSALVATLPFGGVAVLAKVVGPAISTHALPVGVVVGLVVASAVVAAALALVQHELGRSFAFLLSANNALVMLGTVNAASTGAVGGELLWAATLLATTGLGVTAAMVELRVGATRVDTHNGLHGSMSFLSPMFLGLGVATAGAPGPSSSSPTTCC